MNDLQVFNYNGAKVRTVEKDGDVWFVAKDICDILCIKNTSQAVEVLDDDEKGISKTYTPSGEQSMTVISESGLYTLLLRSNKEEAKPFRRWVTHDVLPAIHKHGLYATPQAAEQILQDPDTFIKVLQGLKDEREKSAALQAQAEKDRPKVLFAEAVDASKGSVLIGVLAKILTQNGCTLNGKTIGQNKLFAWLRDHDYLHKCKGERYNLPKQWAIDRGLFDVKKSIIHNPDGSTKITHTTKVTGKGQIYFVNKFLGMQS